jgi:hypothetical protein
MSTGVSVSDGAVNAFSNSRRANASSDQIDGVAVGAPGVVLAANGLRIALTTPDTRVVTAVITCGFGFGVGSVVNAVLCMALDSDCVVAIRTVAPSVRSCGSATVAFARAAVAGAAASRLASATVDAAAGVFFLGALGAAGSDPFDVRGLPVGPLSAAVSGGVAVSLGWGVFVVDAGASFVTGSFMPVEAFAGSVPEVVLEVVDPAVPADSSADARPLFHPVTMAAAIPR